jgi:putative ABC transport system permease protein
VIGQTLSLDQYPFLVLGILGPRFTGADVGQKSDLYVPLCADRILHGPGSALENSMAVLLHVMGRPKPGYSPAQVEVRLWTLVGPILAATVPPHLRLDQQETYRQRTFQVQRAAHGSSLVRAQYSQALVVLMVIVGLVLVITCVNIANLLLVRSTARQREMAIRMALGSGRGRLLRQLVVECLLLSSAGTLLGMGLAQAGARLLIGLLSSSVYQESLGPVLN